MTPITWIFIAYLAALLFAAASPARFPGRSALRMAWLWFAMIPIGRFVFALIRLSNLDDPRDIAKTEIWANGIEWLLLGISMLYVAGAITGEERRKEG